MPSSTSDRAGFEVELTATDRPLRDFALWIGILGPPLLWLAQFQTVYMLVYPACGNHRNLGITLTSICFAIAIAVCGWLGWSNRIPVARSLECVQKTRHFMAVLSLMSMSIFLIVLIAQTIASMMVPPCPI
jgi:hypothetical protein